MIRIRTEMLRPGRDALSKENQGRDPDLRFRPAAEELAEMGRTSPTRLSRAQATRWMEHPDELVVAFFVRQFAAAIPDLTRKGGPLAGLDPLRFVSARAHAQATEAAETWTPLLDVIVDAVGRDYYVEHETRYVERLEALHDWLRSLDDPEDLRPLAELDSPAIRHAQLYVARTIPESLIPHWIRSGSDVTFALRNEPMLNRHAPALLVHLLSMDEATRTTFRGELEDVNGRLDGPLGPEDSARVVEAALEHSALLELALLLPSLHLTDRRLTALADPSTAPPRLLAAAVAHPDASKALRRKAMAGELASPSLFANHADTPGEVLEGLWTRFGTEVGKAVIAHDNCPDEVAVRIVIDGSLDALEHASPSFGRGRVALAVLRFGPGWDEDVLRALLNSKDPGPMYGPALAVAFRMGLPDRDLNWVGERILERTREQRPIPVPRDLLEDVLEQADKPIRERLITGLPYVETFSFDEEAMWEEWDRWEATTHTLRPRAARSASRSRRV